MELKKSKKADLTQKRNLYFNIGLIISLSLAISAFEWKSYGDVGIIDLGTMSSNFDQLEVIPPTKIEQPKPPKPKLNPIIKEVDEEVDPPKELIELLEKSEEPVVYEEPEPIVEEAVEPEEFIIVEKMPEFEGGMKGFMKYIAKKMNYPSQARRMGVEGKVFVQFVIDPSGKVVDVKVLKGIGAGCDQEALRVIQNVPKWSPGKQRGKPVRVKMVIPINFTLG